MVNYQYSNKNLHQTSTFTSFNHHNHSYQDDLHDTDNLKSTFNVNNIEWNQLKSIEANVNNDNDTNQCKVTQTDDTTTIESWTQSITDQSFLRQQLLLNKMKNWKLTFEDVKNNQIDDQVATVHVFNRYLTENEYVEAEQLNILTDSYSSPEIIESLTEQLITPTVSDGRIQDDYNQAEWKSSSCRILNLKGVNIPINGNVDPCHLNLLFG
ncbi:spectrin-like nuclear envelope [Schistosoma japonicum]|uniref:Spectrin-like nuclear envelope n=1 Tax=Schistosoma japonicum TaxID=6182 RepID=A0A4Z2D061_SCHJA|nr:spectrin-like nuclear envelope [Schistosoma japonicum]